MVQSKAIHSGGAKKKSSSEPRRIEVSRLIERDGSSHVTLRDLSFAPGVGWFSQKSITLSDDEIDGLIRQLASVRRSRASQPQRCETPSPERASAATQAPTTPAASAARVLDIRPYLES